jgi:hypothetical protein
MLSAAMTNIFKRSNPLLRSIAGFGADTKMALGSR